MGYWGVFQQIRGKTQIVFTNWAQAGGEASTQVYLLSSGGVLRDIQLKFGVGVNVGLSRTLVKLDGVQILPALDPAIWDVDFTDSTRAPWITTYDIDGAIVCGYQFNQGIRFDSSLEIKYETIGIGNQTGANCYIFYEELAA
jgi:hypothetical protein